MSFIIRNLKPDEHQMVRDWANQENWNEGTHDYLAYRLLDNSSFWVGELDGKPIATLSAAQYDDNFAFIGLYICLPEYRGKEYGYKVWQKTLQGVTAKNISLERVLEQQKNYAKSGFKTHYLTYRYVVKGTNKTYKSAHIVQCQDINFQGLVQFDRKNFPADRKQFLQKWINLPESKAVAFMKQENIEGYGVLRVSSKGYRIGPLFANSYEVAEQILKSLLGQVSSDKKVVLDVPEINKDAIKLMQEWKMETSFTCARMYTNGTPEIKFHETVYAITSLEFG